MGLSHGVSDSTCRFHGEGDVTLAGNDMKLHDNLETVESLQIVRLKGTSKMTVTKLETHYLTLGLLENLFVNFGAQASTAIRCRTSHPHIVLGRQYPRWSTDDMKITSHVLT